KVKETLTAAMAVSQAGIPPAVSPTGTKKVAATSRSSEVTAHLEGVSYEVCEVIVLELLEAKPFAPKPGNIARAFRSVGRVIRRVYSAIARRAGTRLTPVAGQVGPAVNTAFIIHIRPTAAQVIAIDVGQHGTQRQKVRHAAILSGIISAAPAIVARVVIVPGIVHYGSLAKPREKRIL